MAAARRRRHRARALRHAIFYRAVGDIEQARKNAAFFIKVYGKKLRDEAAELL